MKSLTFFVMLFASLIANAEPLRLQVTPIGDEQYVSYNENDWLFVAKESNYTVYIAKGDVEMKDDNYMVQSLTVYDGYETYSYMKKPVKRVFTYGALNCSDEVMVLLGSLYTSDDNIVQYFQYFDWGTWVAELHQKGTARNEVMNMICNKTV